MSLFCKHLSYEVLSWKWENLGKPNQRILAEVKCKKCGKIFTETIQGDKITAFLMVYEDKFGR